MEIDLITAGQRIKQIRKKHNYSMATFAKLVGNSSASTVNNWEKGNNLPNKERLEKIAILGNTTANWIRYGTFSEYVEQLLNTTDLNQPLTQQQLQQLLNLLQQKKINYSQDLDILYFTKQQFPDLFDVEYPALDDQKNIDIISESTPIYSIEKNNDYRNQTLPLLQTLYQDTTNRQTSLITLEKVLTFLITHNTKPNSREIFDYLQVLLITLEQNITNPDLLKKELNHFIKQIEQ